MKLTQLSVHGWNWICDKCTGTKIAVWPKIINLKMSYGSNTLRYLTRMGGGGGYGFKLGAYVTYQ